MIRLTIHDEVNMQIEGLLPSELSQLQKKFSYTVPGSFTTAAFKTGNWDGKESLINDDGVGFFYIAEGIADFIESDLGYDLDQDVELIDLREDISYITPVSVHENFLIDETGYTLRDHQHEAINESISKMKGIIDHCTSAGKTVTTLGISKAFDQKLKVMIIVPSDQLSKQTYEYYENTNLKAIRLHSGIKGEKRKEAFDEYDHIIITNKLLLNCLEYVKGKKFFLIIDEIHSYFGGKFSNALRVELANCPGRIGLTGTVPKDKLKKAMIQCHLGGDVIAQLKASTLIGNRQASSLNIRMIQTKHDEVADISDGPSWEWETELKYITSHIGRIEAIANFIKSLPTMNTLVLCHAAAGKILCQYFDGKMITDETPVKTREEWVSVFDRTDDAIVLGSWGTIATGMSKNRIFRLIIIDPGKSHVVQQSIGRGLRLDGDVNHVEVIDISSDAKYGIRHKKDRIKIYKSENFPYEEIEETIEVS